MLYFIVDRSIRSLPLAVLHHPRTLRLLALIDRLYQL